MKKFKFTLEPVLKYKQTLEKKQKAELGRIMAILNQLQEELVLTEGKIGACKTSWAESLRQNRDLAAEMERHYLYLQLLQGQKQELAEKIATAEEEKKEIQRQLIIYMKEIKTLNRLRTEQLAHHLEEVRKDEEKVLNDIISHRATAKSE